MKTNKQISCVKIPFFELTFFHPKIFLFGRDDL